MMEGIEVEAPAEIIKDEFVGAKEEDDDDSCYFSVKSAASFDEDVEAANSNTGTETSTSQGTSQPDQHPMQHSSSRPKKKDWVDHVVWFHRTIRAYWRNQRLACLWLLLYAFANVMAFYYKANIYVHSPEHEIPREVFGSCVVVARGAAMCLNLNAFLILLPLCRHLWTLLQTAPALRSYSCFPSKDSDKKVKRLHWTSWLPLDQWVVIHKVIGVAFLYWTLLHCAAHVCDFYRFSIHPNEEDLLLLFPSEESIPSDPAGRWKFLLQQPAAITGIIMLVCILVAYPCILFYRRLGYNVFWYSHHLLLVMLVALLFHGIGQLLEPPQSIYWVGAPLVLYAIPRIWREVASLFCQQVRVQVLELAIKPGNVVVLKLTKPTAWQGRLQAGMYANVNIPHLSALQWHPFTMSSAPSDDYLEFHIRPVGDWTKELYELAKSYAPLRQSASKLPDVQETEVYSGMPSKCPEPNHGDTPSTGTRLERPTLTSSAPSQHWLWDASARFTLDGSVATTTMSSSAFTPGSATSGTSTDDNGTTIRELVVKVDGPLGAPSSGYSHHRMVVLVGAGIGITPMVSVLKELLANPGKMQRTYLIWTFRERRAMDWFSSLVNDVLLNNVASKRQRQVLQLRFFVTSTSTQSLGTEEPEDASCALTIKYGQRPNWLDELTRVQEDIRSLNYNKCGVFCCGPATMTNTLRQTAFRISRQDPDFHFYCRQESFSF